MYTYFREVYECTQNEKERKTIEFLTKLKEEKKDESRTLVFMNQKSQVERFADILFNHFKIVTCLHGDIDQVCFFLLVLPFGIFMPRHSLFFFCRIFCIYRLSENGL